MCIDDKLSKLVVIYRGKNAVYKFIKAILEEYDYCKKVMKNVSFVMSPYDEQIFQSIIKCWICDILFHVGNTK